MSEALNPVEAIAEADDLKAGALMGSAIVGGAVLEAMAIGEFASSQETFVAATVGAAAVMAVGVQGGIERYRGINNPELIGFGVVMITKKSSRDHEVGGISLQKNDVVGELHYPNPDEMPQDTLSAARLFLGVVNGSITELAAKIKAGDEAVKDVKAFTATSNLLRPKVAERFGLQADPSQSRLSNWWFKRQAQRQGRKPKWGQAYTVWATPDQIVDAADHIAAKETPY